MLQDVANVSPVVSMIYNYATETPCYIDADKEAV